MRRLVAQLVHSSFRQARIHQHIRRNLAPLSPSVPPTLRLRCSWAERRCWSPPSASTRLCARNSSSSSKGTTTTVDAGNKAATQSQKAAAKRAKQEVLAERQAEKRAKKEALATAKKERLDVQKAEKAQTRRDKRYAAAVSRRAAASAAAAVGGADAGGTSLSPVERRALLRKQLIQHIEQTTQDNRISRRDAMREFLVTAEDMGTLNDWTTPNPFRGVTDKELPARLRWYSKNEVLELCIKRWGSIARMEQEKERQRSALKKEESTVSHDGHTSSMHVVQAAMAGNALVALFKGAAFLVTGSGAMLSETIHSLADLANQSLLKVGLTRASLPSDEAHPYGYANEQYIFGLISGVGIFFLGCGVTVAHGVSLLLHPEAHALEHVNTALAVLAGSAVVEGYTLKVAWNSVRVKAKEQDMSIAQYIKDGSDPVAVAVLMEDGVATLGVVVAATSLGLTAATGNVMYDAVGTLCIGGLLGGVAAFLISKNRRLLVGRSIDPARLRDLQAELLKDPMISSMHDVKAVSMGADDVRFKAEIMFNGWKLAQQHIGKMNMSDAHKQLKSPEDLELFLQIFGDELVELLGDEIDRIEEVVQRHIPEARHVDIEVL